MAKAHPRLLYEALEDLDSVLCSPGTWPILGFDASISFAAVTTFSVSTPANRLASSEIVTGREASTQADTHDFLLIADRLV
jgi:hypothetical protein